MKIIYLFTSPSLKGSSVQTKVLNQIKYLNLAGAECRGAFFSTEVKEITPFNEYVDLIPVEKCSLKYFRASGQKRNTMLAVLGYANSKFQDIDFFYFRYPEAGSLLASFTKQFGSKTVFEHLSIEEKEIQLHAKENPFGLRPSVLFSWLEYTLLPLWRESKYGMIIRNKAKLGICNSNEIAEWQNKKSKGSYTCVVGGDAVEIESYPLIKRPLIQNELKLVFLKGASTSADFNGLDRIIKSIKGYKGDTQIKLYILGHQLKAEEEIIKQLSVEQNIILLPAKSGKELFSFLEKIHLGIGTLGLYRKGLDATTTIKLREYTALGLPFIYAYTDPDLHEYSKEFALEFPNDDSIIDMQKVIDFAQKVHSDPQHPKKMRQYAEEHLDYKVKMKKLYVELLKLKNA
jgi:hypothetical protein